MYRTLSSLLAFFGSCFLLHGQGINYQAVVRDAQGNPLASQEVTFRFSYAPGGDTTDVDYTETFTLTTNEFGLANLVLLEGEPEAGGPDNLDFAETRYWLLTELDVDGGSNYEVMGLSPLRNAPYALAAPNNGGTGGGGSFESGCLSLASNLNVCAWTTDGELSSLEGSASAGYTIATDSPHDPTKIVIEGNSSTADSFGDFRFIVDRSSTGPVRYYQFQIFDLSNSQWADPVARGHSVRQELVDGDLEIVVPNVGGNYPNGFRLILN